MLCKEMITRSYDKVIDRAHEMEEVHNTFFEIYNLDQMLVRTIYNDEDIPNRRLLMGGIKKMLTIIPLDLENCVFKVNEYRKIIGEDGNTTGKEEVEVSIDRIVEYLNYFQLQSHELYEGKLVINQFRKYASYTGDKGLKIYNEKLDSYLQSIEIDIHGTTFIISDIIISDGSLNK